MVKQIALMCLTSLCLLGLLSFRWKVVVVVFLVLLQLTKTTHVILVCQNNYENKIQQKTVL